MLSPGGTTRPGARLRPLVVVGLCLATLLGGVLSAGAAPARAGLPFPAAPAAPTGTLRLASVAVPCSGEDCFGPLATAPAVGGMPSTPSPGVDEGETGDGCSVMNPSGCVTSALSSFFRSLVEAALNPLLGLLSVTVLTTPTLESVPRVGQLWAQSWQIVLGAYGLLVMVAGLVLMAHESLQARYTVREIAPRLVVGLLAGAVSLVLAGRAIEVANALSVAVLGDGLDPAAAGRALQDMVGAAVTGDDGGIFLIFLGVFLVVGLVAVLITYVVRVALTLILIVAAPLALMCHALPHTEAVAYWWWKAFAGCLVIQIAQSLVLVTGLRVFLTPGGFSPFGAPTSTGLVNLLMMLALLYILVKIPFWILASVRIGDRRRTVLGTVVRASVIGAALGWIGARHRGAPGGGAGRPPGSPPPAGPRGGGPDRGGGGGGGAGPAGQPSGPGGGRPVDPTGSPGRRARSGHLSRPNRPAGGRARIPRPRGDGDLPLSAYRTVPVRPVPARPVPARPVAGRLAGHPRGPGVSGTHRAPRRSPSVRRPPTPPSPPPALRSPAPPRVPTRPGPPRPVVSPDWRARR